jgi:hypothetical protein
MDGKKKGLKGTYKIKKTANPPIIDEGLGKSLTTERASNQSIPTFDKSVFVGLCEIQCTRDEIAHVLGVKISDLDGLCWTNMGDSFQACFTRYTACGKRSLRRRMWQCALDPNQYNYSMMIWLSKQYLNMVDTPAKEQPDIKPVIITGYTGETITLGVDKGNLNRSHDEHSKDDLS